MSRRLLPKFVSNAARRLQRSESEPAHRGDDDGCSNGGAGGPADIGAENREMLLRHVKREVKQLMEESVARKFIHEESPVITKLCISVENCLLYGLKRQGLLTGVFRENTSLALLHRVAKCCPAASHVLDRLAIEVANGSHSVSQQQRKPTAHQNPQKYQWIRVALLEKRLAKIVEYLVEQGKQLYEPDSILGDPCDGPLLASLLVGPCALDYTKAKSMSCAFKERSTEEMLQHHMMASPMRSPSSPKTNRAPSLRVLRYLYSGGLAGDLSTASSATALSDSSAASGDRGDKMLQLLRQTNRAALLYEKNGVISHAGGASLRDPGPGYLSLHSTQAGLVVKWTPNSVMPGEGDSGGGRGSTPPPSPSSAADEASSAQSGDNANDSSISSPSSFGSRIATNRRQDSAESNSVNWDSAFLIRVEEMVHIHCHGGGSAGGGTVVFVARDGTQQPPLHFPAGGGGGSGAGGSCSNLLQFLTSLETGLAPTGWLDPPLWTHKGRHGRQGGLTETKRKSLFADTFLAGLLTSATSKALRNLSGSGSGAGFDEEIGEEAATDCVFRIVLNGAGFSFESAADSNSGLQLAWQREESASRRSSRGNVESAPHRESLQEEERQASVQLLCSRMRKQILSRAFNGWLSHVRQARTVRQYLVGLLDVNGGVGGVGCGKAEDFPNGLTQEIWERGDADEIYRAIYWGGCRPEMRKKVWPMMLGFHPWGSKEAERRALDQAAQNRFENLLSEWGPVDVIVRENDKELVIHARDILHKKLEAIEAASLAANSKTKEHFRPQNRRLPDPPVAVHEHELSNICTTEDSEMQLAVDAAGDGSLRSASRESLASPASPASNGGVYSAELIKTVTENWHRIDKDVTRCDRHITFFSDDEHLEKLRNIMCCYVWENLQVGYIQGFCDLLAPLLIVLEDEGLTLACFEKLMLRMVANFPTDEVELREATMPAFDAHKANAETNGGDGGCPRQRSLMNQQLANLNAALQVMDPQLHEHIVRKGEQERAGTGSQQQQQQQQQQLHMHFCFCFRWLLLDFKREICYNDVFLVWETIWAATHLVSSHFSIFVAMALLQEYRGFIMDNDMNLADITMFYIDMAERHNSSNLLNRARDLADQLAKLIHESQEP